MQCQDIRVDDVSLTERSRTSDSIVNRIGVVDVFQRCTGFARLEEVVLEIDPPIFNNFEVLVTLETKFNTDPDEGLDITFDLELGANGGFNDNLVDNGDVRECSLNVDVGLSIENTEYETIQIGNLNAGLLQNDVLINLLITLVETLFGSTICAVIEQAGTLANGDKGILTVVLDDLNERYDDLIVDVDIDIDQTDIDFQQNPVPFGATPEQLAAAVNLADSNAVEIVSVALNDFLGNQEVSPLPINQAINLLTDPDGEISIDLRNLDIQTVLPLDFTDITVKLEAFKLEGANTISLFNILQNDFTDGGDGRDFTLDHSFALDEMTFKVTISLTFDRGEWVTASSCGNINTGFEDFPQCNDRETFSFDFGLTINDIAIDLATLIAVNLEEIGQIQIGQILDQHFSDDAAAALNATLNCVAPSLYALHLSDFAVSVDEISNPVVENFSGQGLTDLIISSTELINLLLKNVLANDLPLIMRGAVRDTVNEFLKENITSIDDFEFCPSYVQDPSIDPYLNFDSALAQAGFDVVNDVLGNFDVNSNVDANDLIQTLLGYYSENAEEFPFEAASEVGDWDTKDEFIPVSTLPAFAEAFSDAENAFISIESLSIRNLDTLSLLKVSSLDNFPKSISIDATLGDENSPLSSNLELRLSFDFQATGLGLNDPFILVMQFQALDIAIVLEELLFNIDSLNRLRLDQLTHTPCLGSMIDGMTYNLLESNIVASTLRFSLILGNPSSNSGLGIALRQLRDELDQGASGEELPRTLNYFVDVIFKEALRVANENEFPINPENCLEADSLVGNILDIFQGIGLPNATFISEVCLADIEPLAPVAEYERAQLGVQDFDAELPGSYLDLENSFVFGFISGFLRGTSDDDASTLQNLLVLFANTTGNPLSDALILEKDNETVSFEMTLNEETELLRLLNLDPIRIANEEGFVAEARRLKLTGINRFLSDFELLQPISTFTTKHHVGFSDEDPLQLEIELFVQANASILDDLPADAPPIQELISITMDLEGVSVDVELLTAVRTDLLSNLSVAHFLNITGDQHIGFTDFSLSCLGQNMHENGVHFRQFLIDISDVTEPQVNVITDNELVSEGFAGVMNQVISVLTDFYLAGIPNICQNCLRDVMNQVLEGQVDDPDAPICPDEVEVIPLPDDQAVFRFSDSEAFANFQDLLQNTLFDEDFELWNLLIEGLTTEAFFDTNPFDTGRLNFVYKNVSYGALQIILSRMDIEGLESFTNVVLGEIVDEDDPYRLKVAFDFDGPMDLKLDLEFVGYDLFIEGPVVANPLELGLSLEAFSFALDFELQFDLNRLMRVQFNRVDSLEEIPCVLVPVSKFDINDFNFTTGEIGFSVGCNGVCQSDLINTLTVNGTTTFFSDNDEDIAALLNRFTEILVQYVESSPAQDLIDVALETSETNCDALAGTIADVLSESSLDIDAFSTMLYIFFGILAVLGVAVVFQIPRHRRRLRRQMKKLRKSDEKEFDEQDEIKILRLRLAPLNTSPAIPILIKLFVPLVCLVNLAGLWIAILREGALTVQLTFTILAMQTTTVNLVPMSVVSTVNDIWSSGAWPLAVLIAVASCAWPIVKNSLLILVWVAPGTIVSSNSRGRYLEILDILGKWSLLDVFVVVVTQAALFTFLSINQLEDLSFIREDFFQFEIATQPNNGIVILSGVAASSLLINHVMAYYHHKSIEYVRKQYDKLRGTTSTPKEVTQRKRLSGYHFKKQSTKISPLSMCVLLVANIITGGTVIGAIFLPVLRFEHNGLLGVFTEQLDPASSNRVYSIFSLGLSISEAPNDTFYQRFIIILFQFMYYLVSVIMPMVQPIMLFFLMNNRFKLENLRRMIEFTMIVSFWAALDCVFVGIIVTVLEVSQVVKFVVDFITDDICTNLETIFLLFIEERDANCLSVIGRLGMPGAAVLAVGVYGQLIVLIITTVLAYRVYEDRYYHAYVEKRLRRDGKPRKLDWLRRLIVRMMTTEVRKIKGRTSRNASKSRDNLALDTAPEREIASQPPLRRSPTGPAGEDLASSTNPIFDSNNEVAGSTPSVLRSQQPTGAHAATSVRGSAGHEAEPASNRMSQNDNVDV